MRSTALVFHIRKRKFIFKEIIDVTIFYTEFLLIVAFIDTC